MPIKISEPVTKEFVLVKTDEFFGNTDPNAEPTKIIVRLAAQGDVAVRSDYLNKFEREFDGEKLSVHQEMSPEELKLLSVYLTLADCNILNLDGKTKLFKFKDNRLMSKLDFERAWAMLDPLVADEIYEKVLEMNPQWTERGEA